MEDYTDIILLSRDLVMYKEEANTLECDKMRLRRCVEKLRQDLEYENLNLERDRKRLKKGQQCYAKLCTAKSDLHKSLGEKERLKQTVDEDAKQLRYKITTLSNQLEMEQADIQKLAMEECHDEEFDESASNEVLLNLETTGQELVVYSQDLFNLNKKIKQSAWRLKYLSCQITPDSIACDLSSDEEECTDNEKISNYSDLCRPFKCDQTVCDQTVGEVQATPEQQSIEVQVSSPMTIKAAQTDSPVIVNDSAQTTEVDKSVVDKHTETIKDVRNMSTQTDEVKLTLKKSVENILSDESKRESKSYDDAKPKSKLFEDKRETKSWNDKLDFKVCAIVKACDDRTCDPIKCDNKPCDPIKCDNKPCDRKQEVKRCDSKCNENEYDNKDFADDRYDSSCMNIVRECKESIGLPLAESTRLENISLNVKCPENISLNVKCPDENLNKVPACDSISLGLPNSLFRATDSWKDSFLDCQSLTSNKTQHKVTQTVERCVNECKDNPITCVNFCKEQAKDLTKNQTCQTTRTIEPENHRLCASSCAPSNNCQQTCQTTRTIEPENHRLCASPCAPSNNCQSLYQSYYANSPRLSPLCYSNDCTCTQPVMLYNRDCTPTYCNLTPPNHVPVRECASPPEQLGSQCPQQKIKDETRDLQSDQYPTKDESDASREAKMKSTSNFGHYPKLNHATLMPASYPTIPQNRNSQVQHQPAPENWAQDNELPKQDYPPNYASDSFFNSNLPTQDTRNGLNSGSNNQPHRDESYYQVNVSPPEDCWTEIQSRFTGLLSLYTSDRMTPNSDSDLDSVISTRPTFQAQPKTKPAAKSANQVTPLKKSSRTYR